MPTIRPWDAAPLRRAFAGLDPAGLAQEWLRHNPAYRRDHAATMTTGKVDAEAWRAFARRWGGGGVFPVDPDLPAWLAPAFWDPDIAPEVAVRGDGGDLLSRLAPYARARHDGSDGIHLVLDSAAGPLRIVIVVGRQPDVPGTWFIIDDRHLATRLASVTRFGRLLAGQTPGPLPSTLRLSPQQKLRQVRMLCIAEGRRMGVAVRRIAAGIYGEHILHLSRNELRASSWHRAFYRDLDGADFYLNGGHIALLQGLKQGGDSLVA